MDGACSALPTATNLESCYRLYKGASVIPGRIVRALYILSRERSGLKVYQLLSRRKGHLPIVRLGTPIKGS